MNNNIGKNIKNLRLDHHMTQQTLADQLNVTNKTISKWETGRNLPDVEMIGKLSQIFNISVDELLTQRKGLRLKTKKFLQILFIELILFVLMLLFVNQEYILYLVLTFALPNILIMMIAVIVSYFISLQSQWIKIFKYISYIALAIYDTLCVMLILSSNIGAFLSPINPVTFYIIIMVLGVIIGV